MEEIELEQDENSGYNKKTINYVKDSDRTFVKLRHFTWDDIEDEVGRVMDTVIMDCEGCWVTTPTTPGRSELISNSAKQKLTTHHIISEHIHILVSQKSFIVGEFM